MKLLLFVGIIAVTLAIGESFQCYNCTDCGDSFNKKTAHIATCKLPICAKVVIKYVNGNKKAVARTCLEYAWEGVLARGLDPFPKVGSVYPCREDLCNVASSTESISLLLSILTILTIKLLH